MNRDDIIGAAKQPYMYSVRRCSINYSTPQCLYMYTYVIIVFQVE